MLMWMHLSLYDLYFIFYLLWLLVLKSTYKLYLSSSTYCIVVGITMDLMLTCLMIRVNKVYLKKTLLSCFGLWWHLVAASWHLSSLFSRHLFMLFFNLQKLQSSNKTTNNTLNLLLFVLFIPYVIVRYFHSLLWLVGSVIGDNVYTVCVFIGTTNLMWFFMMSKLF